MRDLIDKPNTNNAGGKIPPKPNRCECGAGVDVLFIRVRREGKTETAIGPFSCFGIQDRGTLRMRTGFEFVQWVGLCGSCYYFGALKKYSDKEGGK